jgi:hypothetical protein
MGILNSEPLALLKNHVTMIQYSTDNDPDFKLVSSHLRHMVQQACDSVEKKWSIWLGSEASRNADDVSCICTL